MRAGWAGSTITATRRALPETREAPCSTTQVPKRDSTRETATCPGSSGCSAVRSARPATARPPTAACRRPSRRRAARPASAPPRAWPTRPPPPGTGRAGRGRRVPRGRWPHRPATRAGPPRPARAHPTDEGQLGVVEQRLAGLAVQPQAPPHLPGGGAQGGDQLLVPTKGHVEVPAGAAGRVAAGGLVQGGDPTLGAGDVGELVDVVLVVLVEQ